MSKYEKKGTITFSPTAITDKEEVHDIYKRTESGCECNSNSNQEWDLELSIYDEGLSLANIAQNTDNIVVERGSVQDCVDKVIKGQPVKSVLKCVDTYNGVPSSIQIIPMYHASLGYSNGRLLGITGVDCTGDVVSIHLKTDNSIFDAYYSSK